MTKSAVLRFSSETTVQTLNFKVLNPEFQLDQDPRLQKSHLGLGFLDGNSQLEQRNQK